MLLSIPTLLNALLLSKTFSLFVFCVFDRVCCQLNRMPTVLATCPNRIYVLLGTLNVISELSPRAAKFYRHGRSGSATSFNVQNYQQQLEALIEMVKKHNDDQEITAKLIVMTLPPISDYMYVSTCSFNCDVFSHFQLLCIGIA
jgi:hypothetical protein